MALQNPHSPAAETRTFAGPWLRFGSGTGPLDGTEWRGSVLCLTRAHSPAAAPAAPSGGSSGPNGAARPGFLAAAGAGPAAASAGLAGAAAGAAAAPRPALLLRDARSGGSGGSGKRRLDQPTPLDSCEGWTAWRFELELSLTEWQRPLDYHIEAGGQLFCGQFAVASCQHCMGAKSALRRGKFSSACRGGRADAGRERSCVEGEQAQGGTVAALGNVGPPASDNQETGCCACSFLVFRP